MTDTADTTIPTAETAAAPVAETTAAPAPDTAVTETDDSVNMALDCEDVIKTHIIAAMAVGLMPVPGIDLAGTVAVQARMVSKLCEIHGVTIRENAASTIVLSLLGGVLPVVLAGTFVSGLKVIPGLGSMAGAAGSSILGGAVTYAIGRVFQQHLETHDSLIDIDVEKMKATMQAEFTTGLKVARSLRDRVTGAIGSKAKPAEAATAEAPEAEHASEPTVAEAAPAAEPAPAEPVAPFAAGLKVARSLRDRVTGMIVAKAKPDEAPAVEQPAAAEPAVAEPAAAEHTAEHVAEAHPAETDEAVAGADKQKSSETAKGRKASAQSTAV